MTNEQFVQSLYGRWEMFFAQKIEPIIDELLNRFDIQTDYIEIESLDLEIGIFLESEFEEKFPVIFRERLEEALLKCFHQPEQTNISIKQISDKENICELFFYFLIHGSLPWSTPSQYKNIHMLFMEVLHAEPQKLKYFLQTYGHYSGLQERLIYQLGDNELEAGVNLLRSSESVFICSYVKFLTQRCKQPEEPAISSIKHRNIVWNVVYSYLLSDTGSYFNRKIFLEHTITRLATAHNITYSYLLQVLTSELETFSTTISPSRGLYALLMELKQTCIEKENKKKSSKHSDDYSSVIDQLRDKETKDLSDQETIVLKGILSDIDMCRLFIQSADEKKKEDLVHFLFPKDTAFVISFLQNLNKFWDTGYLRNMTGSDIRLLQWSVVLSLLANNPSSSFNRYRFIYEVLKKVTTDINVDIRLFLKDFFEYIQTKGSSNELASIINALSAEYKGNTEVKINTDKIDSNSPSDKKLPWTDKPNESEIIYVNNAGLVLLAPFLSRLFHMVGFLEDGKFIGREEQIRAAFLLQYLVFGDEQREYPEHELVLNKILVALDNEQSIPQTIELTEEECSHAEYLLKSVLQHWEKLRNTSLAGLREAFLQREGKLEFKDDSILLTVESKAYDVLLDSVPWNFRTVKFLWMRQVIQVRWR